MNENLSSIINNCYKSVQHRTLSDEEVSLIDGSLFRFRTLFDHIMDSPEKMMTVLFSSELDSEVLYYPVDVIEFRKILSDGHLSDCCGLALFSYKVAKKWLGGYPVLLGIRVDKRDLHSYGGFGIYKYEKLGLADGLERMVIDTDVVNDVSFADIENIVREENVKADLIRVKEPRALSEMVLASYFDVKTADSRGDNLREFLKRLGVYVGSSNNLIWNKKNIPINWGHFSGANRPVKTKGGIFFNTIMNGHWEIEKLSERPEGEITSIRIGEKGNPLFESTNTKDVINKIHQEYQKIVKEVNQPVVSYFNDNVRANSNVEAKIYDLFFFAGVDFKADVEYDAMNELDAETLEKIVPEVKMEYENMTGTKCESWTCNDEGLASEVYYHTAHVMQDESFCDSEKMCHDMIMEILGRKYTKDKARSDLSIEIPDKEGRVITIEIFGGPRGRQNSKRWLEYAAGKVLKKKFMQGKEFYWIDASEYMSNNLSEVAKKLDEGFHSLAGGKVPITDLNTLGFVASLNAVAELVETHVPGGKTDNYINLLSLIKSGEDVRTVRNAIKSNSPITEQAGIASMEQQGVISSAEQQNPSGNVEQFYKLSQNSRDNLFGQLDALLNRIDIDRLAYLQNINEQVIDDKINMLSKDSLTLNDKIALFYGMNADQFYNDLGNMRLYTQLIELRNQLNVMDTQFGFEQQQQPEQQQPEQQQPEQQQPEQQPYNFQEYNQDQYANQPLPLAAEQMETLFKLATSNMGMGPDSGLEESGHGYEGGIQQMEEQKKYVHPNIIPSKYKQGDMVQFRGGGIGDGPGSKGKIIAVRNDKVTIQWTEGKRKGKTHTIPKDSVILDRYIQII
jgi:cell division protein ZapA (FtsZ GTPase activity inhibitor)